MMFERFTPEARTVVVHAQEHARRLGHGYIGCEHLLLALSGSAAPAGAVLREHGVTPERVEEQIVSRVGLGAGASLFADLDRDALATIGVDIDAVRARIEASFGADALTRAGQRAHRRPRRRNLRRALPPALVRRWHRWRRARRTTARCPDPRRAAATGRYHAGGALPGGHIPFTRGAKQTLENTLRQATARHDGHIGVEHIALGLLATEGGLVAPILSALGAATPAMRTAILHRYEKAS